MFITCEYKRNMHEIKTKKIEVLNAKKSATHTLPLIVGMNVLCLTASKAHQH